MSGNRTARNIFTIAASAIVVFALSGPAAEAARIACTQEALHARIAALNLQCSGDKTITFDCRDTTIFIDDNLNWLKTCNGGDPYAASCSSDADCGDGSACRLNQHGCNSSGAGCTGPGQPFRCCTGPGEGTCCSGDMSLRRIECDGVTIDGEDRNITLRLDPPCDARVGSDGCTEIEQQAHVFQVQSDDVTIRNLTTTHFSKNFMVRGRNVTIENVTVIRPCDSALAVLNEQSGYGPGRNVVFRNNEITDGCDKCVTLNGHELPDSDLPYPEYNSQIIGNRFQSCRVPIKANHGRHLVSGNEFLDDESSPWGFHNAVVAGVASTSSYRPVIYWQDNVLDGARVGLEIRGEASLVSLGGNHVTGCRYTGLLVAENGAASIAGDVFTGNGGFDSVNDWEGGIVVDAGSGRLDAGGRTLTIDGRSVSSAGGNQLFGNHAAFDSTQDIWNHTSVTVGAAANWWGDTSPSDQVTGPVDTSAPLDGPPSNDPPEALPTVTGVRRNDTRD